MKKLITVTLLCFSLCSYSQISYIFNHSGADPTIQAHQKPFSIYDLQYFIMDVPDTFSKSSANISIFPGYYSQYSQASITDSTNQGSYFTVSSEGIYMSSITNTTPYNQFAHGIIFNPYYIRFGNPNHSELSESKIIVKLPISNSITIDNIVTIENDTLKVIYLAAPLTVQGIKTLITQK